MYNNVFKYDILRSLGWLSMISHGHTWLSGGRLWSTAWYTAVTKRSNQTTVSNPDKD